MLRAGLSLMQAAVYAEADPMVCSSDRTGSTLTDRGEERPSAGPAEHDDQPEKMERLYLGAIGGFQVGVLQGL